MRRCIPWRRRSEYDQDHDRTPRRPSSRLNSEAPADGLNTEKWLRRRAAQEIHGRRSRYTLAELVEQSDPQAPLSAEERELDGFRRANPSNDARFINTVSVYPTFDELLSTAENPSRWSKA